MSNPSQNICRSIVSKGLGMHGEEVAQTFLQKEGYAICHTNWRYGHKEIDIIAMHADVLAFIEVKTRTSKKSLNPNEIFTKQKQRFYIECAYVYREEFALTEYAIRFDIICVHALHKKMHIEHWRDVIDVRNIMGCGYTHW